LILQILEKESKDTNSQAILLHTSPGAAQTVPRHEAAQIVLRKVYTSVAQAELASSRDDFAENDILQRIPPQTTFGAKLTDRRTFPESPDHSTNSGTYSSHSPVVQQEDMQLNQTIQGIQQNGDFESDADFMEFDLASYHIMNPLVFFAAPEAQTDSSLQMPGALRRDYESSSDIDSLSCGSDAAAPLEGSRRHPSALQCTFSGEIDLHAMPARLSFQDDTMVGYRSVPRKNIRRPSMPDSVVGSGSHIISRLEQLKALEISLDRCEKLLSEFEAEALQLHPEAIAQRTSCYRQLGCEIEAVAAATLEMGCERDVPGAMDLFEQTNVALERLADLIAKTAPSQVIHDPVAKHDVRFRGPFEWLPCLNWIGCLTAPLQQR
jgi:hypothetical protein